MNQNQSMVGFPCFATFGNKSPIASGSLIVLVTGVSCTLYWILHLQWVVLSAWGFLTSSSGPLSEVQGSSTVHDHVISFALRCLDGGTCAQIFGITPGFSAVDVVRCLTFPFRIRPKGIGRHDLKDQPKVWHVFLQSLGNNSH